MKKNKTAIQSLISWGDEMMKEHPMKILSFAQAIDKAEELLKLEKEQIRFKLGKKSIKKIKYGN